MTVVKMNIMTITKTILDVQPASPNLIMILNYLTEGTNREKVVNGHRYLYDAKVSDNRSAKPRLLMLFRGVADNHL